MFPACITLNCMSNCMFDVPCFHKRVHSQFRETLRDSLTSIYLKSDIAFSPLRHFMFQVACEWSTWLPFFSNTHTHNPAPCWQCLPYSEQKVEYTRWSASETVRSVFVWVPAHVLRGVALLLINRWVQSSLRDTLSSFMSSHTCSYNQTHAWLHQSAC